MRTQRPGQAGDSVADELWRDEVWTRSVKAGEYLDMFTTMPPLGKDSLMRLPKCLARDKDGTIVKREDMK